MNAAALIGEALASAGTALAVIAEPEGGLCAVLEYLNAPFASLLGRDRAALTGQVLTAAFGTASLAALGAALQVGRPVTLDMAHHLGGADRWMCVRLAFTGATPQEARRAVLIGHDVTEARREAARDDALRRLLASIFARVNAPVAIVAADGAITMANPAFHRLAGLTAAEAHGVRVNELTAPEFADVANAARAKQLRDGERYDMPFELLAKGGGKIPVHLTSMLLRDGDQRLRVVTLLPLAAARSESSLHARDVGELRAVSLAAFQVQFGANWEKIATRAMLKAEQIIRHRLRPGDVLTRSEDCKFAVWFESTDSDDNEAVLAGAVREIRLRFLSDFGEEVASHVSAAVVPGAPRPARAAPSAAARPTANMFEQMLQANKASRNAG